MMNLFHFMIPTWVFVTLSAVVVFGTIGLIVDSLVRAYKTFDPDPLLYIEEIRKGQPCLTVVRKSDYRKYGTR